MVGDRGRPTACSPGALGCPFALVRTGVTPPGAPLDGVPGPRPARPRGSRRRDHRGAVLVSRIWSLSTLAAWPKSTLKSYIEAGAQFTEMPRQQAEAFVKTLVKSGDIRRRDAEQLMQTAADARPRDDRPRHGPCAGRGGQADRGLVGAVRRHRGPGRVVGGLDKVSVSSGECAVSPVAADDCRERAGADSSPKPSQTEPEQPATEAPRPRSRRQEVGRQEVGGEEVGRRRSRRRRSRRPRSRRPRSRRRRRPHSSSVGLRRHVGCSQGEHHPARSSPE